MADSVPVDSLSPPSRPMMAIVPSDVTALPGFPRPFMSERPAM